MSVRVSLTQPPVLEPALPVLVGRRCRRCRDLPVPRRGQRRRHRRRQHARCGRPQHDGRLERRHALRQERRRLARPPGR
jgi:hypothetical protein